MNAQHLSDGPVKLPLSNNDDEIDLLSLLGVLIDARFLIACITVLFLLLGGIYASLSPLIYEANSLIQVESSAAGGVGGLGEANSLFAVNSPAAAEMEIIRSRLVVSKAVDGLQLYMSASPKYFPFVGSWLALRATNLSNPGFMGTDGYVWGNEAISLGFLELPVALEGKPLVLVATKSGFDLRGANSETLVSGKIGVPAKFGSGASQGQILVTALKAKSGAYFNVTRSSRLGQIVQLQRQMLIKELGQSSGVIEVKLQGADPSNIARILNAIGISYVRQNTERKSAEAEKSLEFLSRYLPQLKQQLETAELRFNNYRNQKGTFDLGVEAKNYLDTVVKLQSGQFDLQQKRRALSSQFTAAHPSIQVLDAQMAANNSQIAEFLVKIKTLPSTEQELLRLMRDVKVNGEIYLSLLNSSQQLRLVKEGKVGNARVVDAAVVPEYAIKPQRMLILAVSGGIGLLLGMGLAILRASQHLGIKDPADIEAAIGLHVFATIPLSVGQSALDKLIDRRSPGIHLLSIASPDDPSVESMRSLRTALQFAMLDARNNVVLLSGPTPGVGKSFTSANFAGVLAAGGKRVLLVDADMRKGYLHQFFGLDRGQGLSELIIGTRTPEEVVHRAVAPNLDLITTGTMPPNAGEVLLLSTTVSLLDKLSGLYDLVIIDTPPVLAVADTQVLARYAGAVLLVVRANVSSIGELQESTKRLGLLGVPVNGVIFNGLDTSKQRYGGYGYKSHRYRYANYNYGNS